MSLRGIFRYRALNSRRVYASGIGTYSRFALPSLDINSGRGCQCPNSGHRQGRPCLLTKCAFQACAAHGKWVSRSTRATQGRWLRARPWLSRHTVHPISAPPISAAGWLAIVTRTASPKAAIRLGIWAKPLGSRLVSEPGCLSGSMQVPQCRPENLQSLYHRMPLRQS